MDTKGSHYPTGPSDEGKVKNLVAETELDGTFESLSRYMEDKGYDLLNMIAPPPLDKVVEPLDQNNETVPGQVVLERDSGKLLKSYMTFRGINDDIISSYDNWITKLLIKQLRNYPVTLRDGTFVRVSSVSLKKPVTVVGSTLKKLYPNEARNNRENYDARVIATFKRYRYTKMKDGSFQEIEEGEPAEDILVAKIPVMLGSVLCHTRGMTDEEKLKIGECPYDPYGYFILKMEYNINTNESLRKWRVLTFLNPDKEPITRITVKQLWSTSVIDIYSKSSILRTEYTRFPDRASPVEKGDKKYLGTNLCVFQILRILGGDVEGLFDKETSKTTTHLSKQELTKERLLHYVYVFVPQKYILKVRAILEPSILWTLSISDDIQYMIKNYGDNIVGSTYAEKKKRFVESIHTDLFPHMIGMPITARMYMTGFMTARMAMHLAGLRDLDNRDDWGNKSLNMAGPVIAKLFGAIWGKMTSQIESDMKVAAPRSLSAKTVARKFLADTVSNEIYSSFTTKYWGTKGGGTLDENMTEILKRENRIGTISALRKVTAKTSSKATSGTVRDVHPSQLGYIDIYDTPESNKCGIVKALTIGCFVSVERNEGLVYNLMKKHISQSPFKLPAEWDTPCFLNGKFLGWCDGRNLKGLIDDERRLYLLDFDISAVLETDPSVLIVSTDEGRCVRPLLVVNKKTRELVIDEKKLWGQPFRTLMENGAIDFMDAFEYVQERTLVADTLETFDNRYRKIEENLEKIEDLKSFIKKVEQDNEDIEPENVQGGDGKEEVINSLNENILSLETEKAETVTKKFELLKKDFPAHDVAARTNRARVVSELKKKEVDLINKISVLKRELKVAEIEINLSEEKRLIAARKGDKNEAIEQINREIESLQSYIAIYRNRAMYSHVELAPDALLSYAVGIIPFPGTHNGARNVFQASMGKSAVGIHHTNHYNRYDTGARVLRYPSAPIVRPRAIDLLGMENTPIGYTAMVAVMQFGGHNQEDAIIMNGDAIERGLFTSIHYPVHKLKIVKSTDYRETFAAPRNIKNEKHAKIYQHIGPDGFAIVGRYLSSGQAAINKVRVYKDGKVEDIPEIVGPGGEGRVDRILIPKTSGSEEVGKVKLVQVTKPKVGDKFALMYSQKGTISKILSGKELPYIEGSSGAGGEPIRPDIIINPMALPSRMTVGMPIEMISATVALLKGELADATAFNPIDIPSLERYLESRGLDKYGKVWMVNPDTGRRMEQKVYYGPMYYEMLRHFVELKIQARGEGYSKITTRQPTRNTNNARNGGLRIGEMERDTFLSHGAAAVLKDRLCDSSDAFTTSVCKKCGDTANVDVEQGTIKCNVCGPDAEFGKITIPYPANVLKHLLLITGTQMLPGFENTEITPDVFEDETTAGVGVISDDESDLEDFE